MRRGPSFRAPTVFVITVTVLAFAVSLPAADTWHVENASIRFVVDLSKRPTHNSCGYFLHIPDGGILPTPFPATHVVTSSGAAVESCVLWQNRRSGVALVFADPGTESRVYVYVAPTSRPILWTPDTGLTPSAILCADPTSGSLAAAQRLGDFGRVGDTVHYVNRAGAPRAPLCIEADHTGRRRPCAFYLLAYLVTDDPGRTWVAPFIMDGQCEVRIDGKKIVPKKRIDKWGGTGQWVQMSQGLHRLDVYQAVGGVGGFSGGQGGLMFLTWRTPKTTMQELGGVRSDKVPMSGTSRMETRVLRDNEIARSGSCVIRSASTRNGGPVARIGVRPTHNYWFEGEEPTLVYELSALARGNPDNTKYTWSFAGGGEASGKRLSWLFPGHRENAVKLRATSGNMVSECVQPFFGFSTIRTSLNSAMDRQAYRKASLDMFEAFPAGTDPSASFGAAYWSNLFRTLELGTGYPLYLHFFTVRPGLLKDRLSSEQLALMQDLFLDFAPRVDASEAINWARTFQAKARDGARKRELRIIEAEMHMYYTGNTNAARVLLKAVTQGGGMSAERARIRLGDIAFMAGDLNLATRYYSDVQNRVRHRKRLLERRAAAGPGPTLERRTVGTTAIRSAKAMRASKSIDLPSEDWKLRAFLDVARAENVRNFIEQGQLLDAWKHLREWELQFPMSKVSSDFLIHESTLYMRMKNWRRARPMIESYCRLVDASSFMAEAAESAMTCMMQLNVPRKTMKEFAELMGKRLEHHPSGGRFKTIAERY